MVKSKGTDNELQNTTQETRLSNMNPTTTRGELMSSLRKSSFCSISGTYRVTLVTNRMISH